MGLKTFALERTMLTLGGWQVKGYADGEGVSVSWSEDDWVVASGTHNEVLRAKKSNATASMKIRLQQGNPSNQWLMDTRNKDVSISTMGQGSFPVTFKDHNSDTEIRARRGYVLKPPDLAFSTEPGVREWEVILTDPQVKLGEISE